MFILVCSFSTIILAEINSGDITTRPNMSGSPTLFHCTCWKLGISQQLLFIGLDYNDCPDPYIRKVNGLQVIVMMSLCGVVRHYIDVLFGSKLDQFIFKLPVFL